MTAIRGIGPYLAIRVIGTMPSHGLLEVVVGLVRQGGVVDVDVVKFLGNVVERTIQSIDLRG